MLRILILMLIALFSTVKTTSAANLTITADFTPTVSNPGNNGFVNTTQIQGYCFYFPTTCANKGVFSINLPVTSSATRDLVVNDYLSLRMPSAWRDVSVVNRESGESHTLRFSVTGAGFTLSGRAYGSTGGNIYVGNGWDGKHISAAPQDCGTLNEGGLAITSSSQFFWLWPNKNNTRCETRSTWLTKADLKLSSGSIMYQLETPNPLLMGDGIYEGTLSYSVAGSGADIELGGELFQTSDDNVDINFYLTVTHELRISSQDTELALHACQQGKICSEAQNAANWERAFVSNIAPAALTAKSDFSLSSTGSFTVHLSCEFNVGDDCGLQSEKTQQTVPLKASLTLPGNIADASGRPVRDFTLKNSKDINRAFFSTKEASSSGRKGSVHVEVVKHNVEIMQRSAPDNYRGVVTVNFDPNVWY